VSTTDPRLPAKEQLRAQLMEAGRREEALERQAERPKRRRRRRRSITLGLVLVLTAGAAAGAADLISTGEPVPDTTVRGKQYQPLVPGAPQAVAKAPDPDGGSGWGVGIYTANNGDDCVIAGQVRGVSLGLIRDGRFLPYEADSTGACGDLRKLPILIDEIGIEGAKPRTVVYGRTRDPNRYVIAESDGKTHRARPARGGAFLFVFAGPASTVDVRTHVGPRIQP
jgi:hypothetical protein